MVKTSHIQVMAPRPEKTGTLPVQGQLAQGSPGRVPQEKQGSWASAEADGWGVVQVLCEWQGRGSGSYLQHRGRRHIPQDEWGQETFMFMQFWEHKHVEMFLSCFPGERGLDGVHHGHCLPNKWKYVKNKLFSKSRVNMFCSLIFKFLVMLWIPCA